MYAARHGHIEIAKVLLKAKTNVNERNKGSSTSGATALKWAAVTRSVPDNSAFVRLLLDHGADADAVNEACLDMARDGRVHMLRMLLAHGVGKEHLNKSLVIASSRGMGGTSLPDEATYNEVVRLLLQHGADVNAKYVNDCTALQWASLYGSVAIAQTLLDAGANPNAKGGCQYLAEDYMTGEKGWTALMLALKHAPEPRDKTIASLLMSHGADPDLTSDKGTTTLMVAASGKNNIDIVRTLLDKGANPNQANNSGKTALMAASRAEGNTPMVELLLSRGANVNLADKDGTTALIEASHGGNVAAIRLLLEKGANPNAKATNRVWDEDKFTALMGAAAFPLGDGGVEGRGTA